MKPRQRRRSLPARAGWGLWLGLALLVILAGCENGAAPALPTLPPLPQAGQPLATRLPTPTAGPAVPADGAPAAPADVSAPTDPPASGGAAPHPPVAGGPAWTFSVVGDTWKDTPMLRYIFQDTAAAGDALLIDLGDITPQGRPEQMADFARLATGAGLPVYPVPGNHDVAWSHTTAPFEAYWPRHQSFDHQNGHFTLVDDSAIALTHDELAWIDADLSATQQPLKFVFMHVPVLMPYPVPSEEALTAGAPEFLDLMAKHHVTAVYAGHLHAYTRVEQNGIPYTITGGGGEPLHLPAFLGGRYHYVRVTVHGSSAQDTIVWLDKVPTPAP